jgi:hypothetical protein
VESVPDGIVNVGETFTVTFTDPTTGAQFDGTYTYVGHEAGAAGAIGQDASGAFFLFSNDGSIPIGSNLNTFVAEPLTVCYHAGTMIACPEGERAVETLSIGDLVLTFDGRAVPIKWIGHRRLRTSTYDRPELISPVCIVRDAIGSGIPHRDLLVSPDHAILIDEVLIAARQLINGSTICQDRRARDLSVYRAPP